MTIGSRSGVYILANREGDGTKHVDVGHDSMLLLFLFDADSLEILIGDGENEPFFHLGGRG